jgi:hypothetical protein
MSCSSKIVVFDLDETLGYFTELGMFWDAVKEYITQTQTTNQNQSKFLQIDQDLFNKILDLYPEFLRPNILGILNYLKKKKEKNHCDKLMIYTNNQGPVEWAKYIITYFETKLHYKLFDQIVAAFKVNGKQVELCRTTHMKTHADFIKCTKVPKETQVCFLDDVFYPDMSNEKIYYINVKPYTHDLNFNEMINRCLNSGILGVTDNKFFKELILNKMNKYRYMVVEKTHINQEVDKILSKKILQHLHIFFKMKMNGSTIVNKSRRNKAVKNKTLKIKR